MSKKYTNVPVIQEQLVSGTNIKTINNQSLLGSGNITIDGGSSAEAKMAIVAGSGTTLSATLNTYYNFASEVGTLAITLPTVTDTTHIQKIVFMFTTSSSPAVTFTASGTGVNVIAQDGFAIEASTTYEINAIFNGTKWVIASIKLATTDIQPS